MKQIATLVGCAIGDALGNPFETNSPLNPHLQNWDGQFKDGGTFWKGKAGQYTDDTLMSIALATSLIKCRKFNPTDVANHYLDWYNSKETRGIGGTTAEAMFRLKTGASWSQSGLTGAKIGGNGTAMRAAPLGIVYRNDLSKLIAVAGQDASITHNSVEPMLGSVAVSIMTALMTNAAYNPRSALEDVIKLMEMSSDDSVIKAKLRLVRSHLDNQTEPMKALAEIGSSGYVPETVAAACYCLAKNNNFKDTVVMAVKAGGDTDTTAAIAGAMAGTLYGLDKIPSEYKDKVENFEMLKRLDRQLINI